MSHTSTVRLIRQITTKADSIQLRNRLHLMDSLHRLKKRRQPNRKLYLPISSLIRLFHLMKNWRKMVDSNSLRCFIQFQRGYKNNRTFHRLKRRTRKRNRHLLFQPFLFHRHLKQREWSLRVMEPLVSVLLGNSIFLLTWSTRSMNKKGWDEREGDCEMKKMNVIHMSAHRKKKLKELQKEMKGSKEKGLA